jgi:biopolymer transport protein ExbD
MGRQINVGVVVSLALALCPIAHAGTSTATAKSPTQPSVSVIIGRDGRIAIGERASPDAMIVSSEALREGRIACPGFGDASASAEEVTIGSDPQAEYVSFMRVANWLEDCGVHNLRVVRQGAVDRVSARRGVAVDMQPGALFAIPCAGPARPGAPLTCPKRKVLTYVSLRQDESLVIWGGTGEIRTDLGDLAGDLPKALGSDSPTAERVFIRADAHVTYDQFTQVLDQLNRDGYTRIGLINEDL